MPARCHQDSCSVVWSEVNTGSGPAYQADVNVDSSAPGVDATPTIGCGDNGLQVLLSALAGNILTSQADGLGVFLPGIEYVDFGSLEANTQIAPDRTTVGDVYGNFAISPETYSFTNDTARDALLVVFGSLLLKYAVVGTNEAFPAAAAGEMIRAGHIDSDADGSGDIVALTPFNANWYTSLLVSADNFATPGQPVSVRNFATSGLAPTPGDADDVQYQDFRTGFLFATPLGAGDALQFKHRWAHQGPEQTVNVATAGTGIYADMGGHMVGQALLIPLAGQATL